MNASLITIVHLRTKNRTQSTLQKFIRVTCSAERRKVDLSSSSDRNQWTDIDDTLNLRPLDGMFNVRDPSTRSPRYERLRDNPVYAFFPTAASSKERR